MSPHAGTTRDVLETALDIGGYPVVLSDTAGVRQSDDAVERLGVALAVEQFARADLRLHVTDNDADARRLLAAQPADELVVRNKIDLAPSQLAADRRLVLLSCATGAGVERFVARLADAVGSLCVACSLAL